MAWDAYAVSDDVNIPVQNLLVESGHARLASHIAGYLIWKVYHDFWLTASGEAMRTVQHVFSYSVLKLQVAS